ncbi:MAG: Hsp20 family protein [Phenylobacterium sp.]|uniref:Hsp20 family protein n=1 Tax=Phenylobacterium sp. TaxID=1871053 RepID=UPI0025EA7C4B|nr:Hsp20 family protein [Phenylobacterium sp.]MBI1196477.1 Hsp20 family protein [Phenylobacterium sp.]
MRADYDFSPLYRSLIGADHMASLIDSALQGVGAREYPPYDVEKTAEDGYRITMSVAGFRADELEVMAHPNLLVVRGERARPQPEGAVLHQGLALRPFEQRFELADHVVVTGARFADGLLTIDLVRELPAALKPRRIEINTPRVTPLKRLIEGKRKASKAA